MKLKVAKSLREAKHYNKVLIDHGYSYACNNSEKYLCFIIDMYGLQKKNARAIATCKPVAKRGSKVSYYLKC